MLYAACERVLRPGGVLAVITAGTPRPGGLRDDPGEVIAAARAAGLVYAQHIVALHTAITDGQLTPGPPGAARPDEAAGHPAVHARIHSDLLVFTKRRDRPMSHPRPPHRPRPGYDSRAPQDVAAPLSVWATAQTDARAQRRGRYLPAATAHPAKMLPAIAATAITRYTQPGDLVADPMCGIGTTLVEAVHLGRDAVGVEYEPRWARLAAAEHRTRPPPGRPRQRGGHLR